MTLSAFSSHDKKCQILVMISFIFKVGLTLGDFFVRRRLFRGRAIFNGRAIMSPCVHIKRFNSRKSPTIFLHKLVHHNDNVIYK